MSQTISLAASVAANQTDSRLYQGFPVASLSSVDLLANQNCTVKTNSAGVNAVKSLAASGSPSSGTFTATVTGPDGTTTATTAAIAYNATAAVVQAALRLLTTVGTEGVTCTGGPLPTAVLATFAGPLAAQAVTMTTDSASVVGGTIPVTNSTVGVAPSDILYLIGGRSLKWTSGTSQVWTVTLTGTPGGGTFKLVYHGQATATIAYNASAATVQTALEALSTVGSGNMVVTGSAGGPWTVTAAVTLAGMALHPLYAATNALTGGTNPSVTVAIATQGRQYQTRPFNTDVTALYVTTGTSATTLQGKIVLG